MKRVFPFAMLLLTTIAFAALATPSASSSGGRNAVAGVDAASVGGASAAGSSDAGGSPVPASEAPRELAALLALLRASPCRFERNGRWYDGEKAAAHLQRKLDYAVGRGQALGSTELFIDMAATRSSFSGRPYRVQCGEAAPMPAATWFMARLRELRTH